MDADMSGKSKVVKHGTKEITREGFEYELTANFEIINDKHLCKASKNRTGLFNAASNISNTSNLYPYTFTATTTPVKFAVIASDGTVDDTQDLNFYIDNFKVETALGNSDFDNASFTAYPNPVKNMLNLNYVQDISDVSVFNLLGQQVITKTLNATSGQIDMSGLATGTYFVKVNTVNGTKTIKVIKE